MSWWLIGLIVVAVIGSVLTALGVCIYRGLCILEVGKTEDYGVQDGSPLND
jgi:hypothetical protein